ncbi:MAG: SDR family oxidoreductase [Chitinophagaceae bacterium]
MGELLKDKVIFLTGGSMGIGLECARKYLEEGAKVMIAANDEASLYQSASTLRIRMDDCMFCDVTNPSTVQWAIEKTILRYGKIDVVHNNAGIAHPAKTLDDTSDDEWSLLFDVNVKSILLTTRFAIDSLKKTKGCIINTSSLVGEIGQEDHAAYAATKGAVNALTRSMALDYARYGIRVNAVAPAGVWTDMLRKWAAGLDDPQAMASYLDQIHPLGYCPQGDVIADACVFLASAKASFITGSVMPVSGGAELGYRLIKRKTELL